MPELLTELAVAEAIGELDAGVRERRELGRDLFGGAPPELARAEPQDLAAAKQAQAPLEVVEVGRPACGALRLVEHDRRRLRALEPG